MDNQVIVSAFVLCPTNSGEGAVEWKIKQTHTLYFDLFGVNMEYARTEMGAFNLHQTMDLALEKGVDYLRLFVIDEDLISHESGYEIIDCMAKQNKELSPINDLSFIA